MKTEDSPAIPDPDELIVAGNDELDVLLDRITPENLHQSIDFGRPVGKEARF